jgi:acyl dehydratase
MVELTSLKYEDIEVGQEIPSFSHKFDRMDAIIYAGASGDFNPIHTNPFFAKDVAMLPDVIAHGLFNMALLGKTVVDWIGDPGNLKKLSCQFRGMVIPDIRKYPGAGTPCRRPPGVTALTRYRLTQSGK